MVISLAVPNLTFVNYDHCKDNRERGKEQKNKAKGDVRGGNRGTWRQKWVFINKKAFENQFWSYREQPWS